MVRMSENNLLDNIIHFCFCLNLLVLFSVLFSGLAHLHDQISVYSNVPNKRFFQRTDFFSSIICISVCAHLNCLDLISLTGNFWRWWRMNCLELLFECGNIIHHFFNLCISFAKLLSQMIDLLCSYGLYFGNLPFQSLNFFCVILSIRKTIFFILILTWLLFSDILLLFLLIG